MKMVVTRIHRWDMVLALTTSLVGMVLVAACQGPSAAGTMHEASRKLGKSNNSDAAALRHREVERGRYLVGALGCDDCHTPHKLGPNGPEPDMTRRLSGTPAGERLPSVPKLPQPWAWVGSADMTAFGGPWGVSYASNLTPDRGTGLGTWTAAVFIRTIRRGRVIGAGPPLLPPMPWQDYRNLSDSDLRAIFFFLKTLPPIRNSVPLVNPSSPPARAKRPGEQKG